MDVFALQGDTVDSICWRHFQQTTGITEEVFKLNPGLAMVGPVLPEGYQLTLPDRVTVTPVKKLIQLWD